MRASAFMMVLIGGLLLYSGIQNKPVINVLTDHLNTSAAPPAQTNAGGAQAPANLAPTVKQPAKTGAYASPHTNPSTGGTDGQVTAA